MHRKQLTVLLFVVKCVKLSKFPYQYRNLDNKGKTYRLKAIKWILKVRSAGNHVYVVPVQSTADNWSSYDNSSQEHNQSIP